MSGSLVIKRINSVFEHNVASTVKENMSFEIGVTSKGRPTVIYRNFEYVKEIENVGGTVAWRCRSYQGAMKCRARLVTAGNRVVSDRQPEHNHAGNVASALARKAVGDMKNRMTELTATPASSQAAVMSNLDHHVLMALPKRSTLTQALRRHRQKVTATLSRPLPALPTDLSFQVPDEFADLILYDSGPDDNRIIIMGCPELLDGLARADLWLADGTFKVVPTLFFQLYSVHFEFGKGICPAAIYCLMTNKTVQTYERVLNELKRLIPLAAPGSILVDFERAAINAFTSAYPTASVRGCYFHLCQSVLRKVNDVGLKVQYETDNEVRGFIRCLPALAFVPPENVLEGFEILVETMPQGFDHLDELVTYFEHTYVRGRRHRGRGDNYGPALFPVALWNQHTAGADGIARTTNSVEGWHHGLQSLFQCHHPTIWTFLTGIKCDLHQQKARFLQGVTGVEQVSKRKYRVLDERVKRAVASYGQSELLTYLRSIAHLSHV